jgi:hypothetical protein
MSSVQEDATILPLSDYGRGRKMEETPKKKDGFEANEHGNAGSIGRAG